MKNILLISFFFLSFNDSSAQYFEWANSAGTSARGQVVYEITSSKDHNLYSTGYKMSSLNIGPIMFINNNAIYFSKSIGRSITLDGNKNLYIMGTKDNTPLCFGNFCTTSGAFLVKFDSLGNTLWVDSLDGVYKIKADSAGNVYLTSSSLNKTRKIKSNGQFAWQHFGHSGSDIVVDKNKNCYLTNDSQTVKLNSSGSLVWLRTYGYKSMAIDAGNRIYLTGVNGSRKITTGGVTKWAKNTLPGNSVSYDSYGNAWIAADTKITKASTLTGDSLTSISTKNTQITLITTDYNDNFYIAGQYDQYKETILCPFQLDFSPGNTDANQMFFAKISTTLPMPVQLGIFTGVVNSFGAPSICSGYNFPVPFTTCSNAASSFGANPGFIAKLNNISIGKPDSAFIPNSTPNGNYRIGVISSNIPATHVYLNEPIFLLSPITSLSLVTAKISASDSTTFCTGDSVRLIADYLPLISPPMINWYKDGQFLASDTMITATASGKYSCSFNLSCISYSDTIQVTSNPLPLAPIYNSGPLSFCSGDSTILSTLSLPNQSYQWKKNNVNIPGANNSYFTAKVSGNYKVKVTNSSGCTKISLGKTVSIICKEGIDITEKSKINIYPNPFVNTFSFSHDEYQNYPVEINVYDLSGRLCESRKINGIDGDELELGATLEKGFYLVEISVENELRRVKILKE